MRYHQFRSVLAKLNQLKRQTYELAKQTNELNLAVNRIAEQIEEDLEFDLLDPLELSTGPFNALDAAGITSIKQIEELGRDGLLQVKGLGVKGVDEVMQAVKRGQVKRFYGATE